MLRNAILVLLMQLFIGCRPMVEAIEEFVEIFIPDELVVATSTSALLPHVVYGAATCTYHSYQGSYESDTSCRYDTGLTWMSKALISVDRQNDRVAFVQPCGPGNTRDELHVRQVFPQGSWISDTTFGFDQSSSSAVVAFQNEGLAALLMNTKAQDCSRTRTGRCVVDAMSVDKYGTPDPSAMLPVGTPTDRIGGFFAADGEAVISAQAAREAPLVGYSFVPRSAGTPTTYWNPGRCTGRVMYTPNVDTGEDVSIVRGDAAPDMGELDWILRSSTRGLVLLKTTMDCEPIEDFVLKPNASPMYEQSVAVVGNTTYGKKILVLYSVGAEIYLQHFDTDTGLAVSSRASVDKTVGTVATMSLDLAHDHVFSVKRHDPSKVGYLSIYRLSDLQPQELNYHWYDADGIGISAIERWESHGVWVPGVIVAGTNYHGGDVYTERVDCQ